MRSFEIQTYKDGKWKMDSVFDDRDICIDEAKKAEQSGRFSGVRVVEEDYDEASDLTTSRTLYRGGAAKTEKSSKPMAAAKPKSTGPRTGKGKEPVQKGKARPKKKKSNFMVPIIILVVLIVGAGATLFGLHYFSSVR